MAEEITLREWFEQRLIAHEDRHNRDREAIDLARGQLEVRLDALNKLRNEVLSDRAEFVRRETLEALIAGLATRIENNNTRVSTLEVWRARATGAAAVLIIIAGTIGALVGRAVFK